MQQEPLKEPHAALFCGLIYSLLSLLHYKYFVDSKTFGGSEGRQDKNKHLLRQARVKGAPEKGIALP